MNRRTFLRYSATLCAAGGLVPLQGYPGKRRWPIGLQLYTVRDQLNRDLIGTLKEIALIGYTSIEGAGYENRLYYGLPPAEFKKIISDLGLTMPSSHTKTEIQADNGKKNIMDAFEITVEDTLAVGADYLVYAWLPPEERETLEDYQFLAEIFNGAGEICKKAGLRFAYHNHDFDFAGTNGRIHYDVLLDETDPDLFTMELDLYWIIKAGFDPLVYFQRYPGRFELWNVKDMEEGPEQFFAEVGQGIIDFRSIFARAGESGLKHYFVEQDECRRPPLESIRISYDYMNKKAF